MNAPYSRVEELKKSTDPAYEIWDLAYDFEQACERLRAKLAALRPRDRSDFYLDYATVADLWRKVETAHPHLIGTEEARLVFARLIFEKLADRASKKGGK